MRKLFNILIPSFFFNCIFSFFIISNGKSIVSLVGGNSFEGGGFSLMIMALYPIHQIYGQLCGAVLYSSGKTNIRNISINFSSSRISYDVFISNENYGGLNLGSIGLIYKMILIQIIVVNIYLWYYTKCYQYHFLNMFIYN